jgi:hypothetical protein
MIRSVTRQSGGLAGTLRVAQPGLQIPLHPFDVKAGHPESLDLGLERVLDL